MNHLLYAAEDHYLKTSEIVEFQQNIDSLAQRLQVYEILREQESKIWSNVANHLEIDFPQETPGRLERGISHWVAVLRYGAMAMLLDNPTFLKQRLLEGLTDIIQVHHLVTLELSIYEQLQTQLQAHLSNTEWELLKPFMVLAQVILLDKKSEEILAIA